MSSPNVVPEHDAQALQSSAFGREIVDDKEHHAPAGDIAVG